MKYLLSILILTLLPLGNIWADQVTVTVKKTAIRADKAFHAKTLTTAKFTQQLQVLDKSKGWFKVKQGGVTGWVHASAVSRGKGSKGGGAASGIGSALSMLSGKPKKENQGKGKKFSEDEVALAGKGFNADVEQQYRNQNPGANFAAVDKLEKLGANSHSIQRFASAGGLQVRSGSSGKSSSKKEKSSKDSGDSLKSMFGKAGDLFKGDGSKQPSQDNFNPLDL